MVWCYCWLWCHGGTVRVALLFLRCKTQKFTKCNLGPMLESHGFFHVNSTRNKTVKGPYQVIPGATSEPHDVAGLYQVVASRDSMCRADTRQFALKADESQDGLVPGFMMKQPGVITHAVSCILYSCIPFFFCLGSVVFTAYGEVFCFCKS